MKLLAQHGSALSLAAAVACGSASCAHGPAAGPEVAAAPSARPDAKTKVPGPKATGVEADVGAEQPGGPSLKVRAFENLSTPITGTPLFGQVVDGRYVFLEYRADDRVGGRVFDASANEWLGIPDGGPRVSPEGHGDPLVLDGYLLFRAGTGYVPSLFPLSPDEASRPDLAHAA